MTSRSDSPYPTPAERAIASRIMEACAKKRVRPVDTNYLVTHTSHAYAYKAVTTTPEVKKRPVTARERTRSANTAKVVEALRGKTTPLTSHDIVAACGLALSDVYYIVRKCPEIERTPYTAPPGVYPAPRSAYRLR